MQMNGKQIALASVAVLALIAGTAIAATYFTGKPDAPKQHARVYHQQQNLNVASSQPVRPACDDGNIVGVAAGAVAGGVVGNQFGGGDGKKLATLGGALGGGYLGQRMIPTHNATCD